MSARADLQELCDLADALLNDDGMLASDALARQRHNREGGRLRDALDYVESRRGYIGRYLRSVRQLVVPVTQYAVDRGFAAVAEMTSDDDLNRCVPGNGDRQSTAGWMAITTENHPVLYAYLLRKVNVKNGQERAISEQLKPAVEQGILPISDVSRILAASRSRMLSRRALLAIEETH